MSEPYRTPGGPPTEPAVSYRVEAPSGLVCKLRKMRGREIVAAAEASDDARSDGFDAILSPCWLGVEDVGPYPFLRVGDARPDWHRLLKGDLLYLFIELRRISIPDGDLYAFPVKCEECGERYDPDWEISLSRDLRKQELPEESAARLRDGRPFEARIASDGRRVTFDLMRSSQDDEVANLFKRLGKRGEAREEVTVVDLLAAQVQTVAGLEGADVLRRYDFLARLDSDDILQLHQDMQAVDCGLDMSIQTRCTNKRCKWVQDTNVPLGRRLFATRRRRPERPEGAGSSPRSSPASRASGSGASSTQSGGTSTGGAGTED